MKLTAQLRPKAAVMPTSVKDETCLSPAVFISQLFLSVHGTKRDWTVLRGSALPVSKPAGSISTKMTAKSGRSRLCRFQAGFSARISDGNGGGSSASEHAAEP